MIELLVEKVQKGVFFHDRKREDMVEYRKTFLNKMKVIFTYFMQFSKNALILLKDYPKIYIIVGPNKWSIIMITFNRSTFLTNNR